MRWSEITESHDLESQQELNLRRNWLTRKHQARLITSKLGYDVYEHEEYDKLIAYIVKGDEPLGYCSCYTQDGVVQINSTFITATDRSKGLGTILYKALIEQGYTLISDTERSPGANALWSKLSKDPELDIQDNGFDRFIGKLKTSK